MEKEEDGGDGVVNECSYGQMKKKSVFLLHGAQATSRSDLSQWSN